jgi:hypothetical protein
MKVVPGIIMNGSIDYILKYVMHKYSDGDISNKYA